MITISVSLTTTKLVVPELCFLFVFLVSRSHGRFHSTESTCGTRYHRIKTCTEHAEPQHLPPRPGGVVALENPIRGGEGVTSEMRTPSQGFALGLGYLLFGSVFPWRVQAAGEKLVPRKP